LQNPKITPIGTPEACWVPVNRLTRKVGSGTQILSKDTEPLG